LVGAEQVFDVVQVAAATEEYLDPTPRVVNVKGVSKSSNACDTILNTGFVYEDVAGS
jgi:hypothetical protein